MADSWERLDEIVSRCREITRAIGLLSWDQQTYMPTGGVEVRAETKAVLNRLAHEEFTKAEVGHLLSELEQEVEHLPYDSDKAGLVRVTRRAYDKEVKLPSKLVAELSKAASLGMDSWEKARAANDFNSFRPYLERIIELQIEKAEALGYDEDRYDALLDLYEPEMKSKAVAVLFDELKAELVPLVQAITDRSDVVDDSILTQEYDEKCQWDFTLAVINTIGFDMKRGRQDRSTHPFTMGLAPTDVRLTTRIDPNNLASGLYASIHEAGHGMYEQGLPMEHRQTLLCDSISLGVHESQSRLWENVVGRSRPFWRYFLPNLAEVFPTQVESVDVEAMYRAVNRVEPSPIRVEADEVTYNLHVFLRFELERRLIHGKLKVADLPEAWNEKMKEYLGFIPENDAQGVLQDVHWSCGLFGYFPTYSLGTILSVQLYNEALKAHPQMPEEMAGGDFSTLKAWMVNNVYTRGSRYTPLELVERITGGGLQTKPYLEYIGTKYREIYGLSA